MMATPTIQLEDLLALREELRQAGFDAGLQRVIAAHNLLLALAAQGRLPADPRAWRTWLAPVFCAAASEQEEFYRRYDAWVLRCAELAAQVAVIEQAQPAANEATQRTDVRTSIFGRLLARLEAGQLKAELRTGLRWLARPQVWLTALAAVVLLVVLARLGQQPTALTLTGQVFSVNEQQPLPNAKVEFAGQVKETDGEGRFAFTYQVRKLDQWLEWSLLKLENLTVRHADHFEQKRDVLLYHPAPQKIILAKPAPLASTGKVTPPPPPIPSPTPISNNNTDTRLKPWQIAVIASPLALYLLWLLVCWLRKQALLEKLPERKVPQLRDLKVEGAERKLFAAARVRRGLLELRRPRPMPVRELNVAATVRATIRQGGLFTPTYGARRTSPEYLLLIDRASAHDEQANVADELYQRLHENGVFVEPYYFQGDARACRSKLRVDEAALSLAQLAARYPEHRLLVFGDGAGFFDHFTGRPQCWLEQFAPWEQRVLLTPAVPNPAGYRERELARRNFLLLPASADGLADLSTWFSFGLTPAPETPAEPPFPAFVEERAHRWLERLRPQDDEIEELAAEVRGYLGQQGWDWLCACAVYPQVTWDLTLYLGYWLFGADDEWRSQWAERVLRLVRLPWFRHGTLPDWWREHLLNEWQGTPHEAQTRRGIERLLWSAINEPAQPVTLEYAEPLKPSWWARLGAWWQRQRLFWRLRTQTDSEDPVRDYVFLRFLAGQRPKRLGVRVPDLLRRLLFKDGQPALGWHPVTLGVAALALAVVCYARFYLKTIIPTTHRTSSEFVTPSVTPTTSPNIQTPTPNQTPIPKPDVKEYRLKLNTEVEWDLVYLPGGEFLMGSDNGPSNERPRHQVRIAPFVIGKFEVTQAQWKAVLGNNPSKFKGDNLPVDSVSWENAHKFLERLTELNHDSLKDMIPVFRLPTEAEWEYAARAGGIEEYREYGFGNVESMLSLYAWFLDNSGGQTQHFGYKLPNRFGLFDMHGNVWEWCQDVWHEDYYGAPTDGSAWLDGAVSSRHVLRGGSYMNSSKYCRAAYRISDGAGSSDVIYYGFRIVMSVQSNPNKRSFGTVPRA